MEARKMSELKISPNVPVVTLGETGGLTSAQQLIDTTASKAFSFNNSTAILESLEIISSFYETANFETEKDRIDIVKKFESIIENKLKKTIDVKKLYYEQFENDLF